MSYQPSEPPKKDGPSDLAIAILGIGIMAILMFGACFIAWLIWG